MNRQPAGIPAGGQFAVTPQSRAEVTLPSDGTALAAHGTPGLADRHQAARERVAAEMARTERLAAQMIAETVTAHHPDAAAVLFALAENDDAHLLGVESVRDTDGQEIAISRDLAAQLNDWADDLNSGGSTTTAHYSEELDVLDVRKNYLLDGDLQ